MSRAAIRYAKAIMDNAVAANSADAVNLDMKTISETVHSNHELKLFLGSPVVSAEVKFNALTEIFSGNQHETKSLLRLLKENKRFEILTSVADNSSFSKNGRMVDNGIKTISKIDFSLIFT